MNMWLAAWLTTPAQLTGRQHLLLLIPLCLSISVVYKKMMYIMFLTNFYAVFAHLRVFFKSHCARCFCINITFPLGIYDVPFHSRTFPKISYLRLL